MDNGPQINRQTCIGNRKYRGIGAGVAGKFAEEGALVVINGRRAKMAEVAAKIREAGGKAI